VGKAPPPFCRLLHEEHGPFLVDGDPNRTALNWAKRGSFPFETVDQRQAMKATSRKGLEYLYRLSSTPGQRRYERAGRRRDLLILPTKPDVISLEPMLQTVSDLGKVQGPADNCAALP